MKKKIFRSMGLLMLFTIVILTGASFSIFVWQLKDEVKAGLETIRISIIDDKGNVVFDNVADINSADNHLSRPEIKEALKKGSGYSERYSKTLHQVTYYYATKMKNNDNILRIAFTRSSVFFLLKKFLPIALISIILAVTFSFFLARRLTRNITKPINEINLDNPASDYAEVGPLITRIKKQNELILEQDKMRREFTANVSHELKTPLTVIKGSAELMMSGVDAADVEDFAYGIYKESGRMISLINDIMFLSKLDEGIMSKMEEIDLLNAVKNAAYLFRNMAKEKNIDIEISGTAVNIIGIPSVIEELIYNLIDNAIKYNRKNGKVFIDIKENDGKILLSVRDTGQGISEAEQEHIFERFYRIDKSRSKEIPGTGLGLAIVKHAVKIHDAKIRIKSDKGGSVFTVEFKKEDIV